MFFLNSKPFLKNLLRVESAFRAYVAKDYIFFVIVRVELGIPQERCFPRWIYLQSNW